jgi:hypothetical protein
MSERNELDLLGDIVKLLRKYGPEAFEDLARQLSSPEFVQRLQAVLTGAARAARDAGVERTGRPARTVGRANYRSALVALEATEPEKAQALLALYDKLMGKLLLPTMGELRSFASQLGAPLLQGTTRPRAVVELVQALEARPLSEIQTVAEKLERNQYNDDRSLANWTRVIFDKELRSRKVQ